MSRFTSLLKEAWGDKQFGSPVKVIYTYNKTEQNDLDLRKYIPTTQPFHFVPLSEYDTYITPTVIPNFSINACKKVYFRYRVDNATP